MLESGDGGFKRSGKVLQIPTCGGPITALTEAPTPRHTCCSSRGFETRFSSWATAILNHKFD